MTARSTPLTFWARVRKTPECWIWTGHLNRGYGRIVWAGRLTYAHRMAWEITQGPIPAGMVIDHLCRNRTCVRPEHLRVVTHRENTLAPGSQAIAKRHAERTHCPHNHAYSPENTIVTYNGRRRCRTCVNAHRRAKWAER